MQPEKPVDSESSISTKKGAQRLPQRYTKPPVTDDAAKEQKVSEFIVRRTIRFPMWEISAKTKLPNVLLGKYTEKAKAITAIQKYNPDAVIKVIEV